MAAISTIRATFVYEFLLVKMTTTCASFSGAAIKLYIVNEIGIGQEDYNLQMTDWRMIIGN